MAARDTAFLDPLGGLLADLDIIASEAGAGFGSRREFRLEPGETRPAAILFLDVVGFTDLARRLGSEELSRLIDRSFRIFDLAVRAEGGYCDKVIGDAGLYVFAGHPNFAPACEAALNAALSVRERIRRINVSLAPAGLSIAVRAGVSFGQVTRSRIGGEAQQLTVMGESVNLAQRLENTALPGTIQTVESVLTESGSKFRSSLRGELDLKGFGPCNVYLVEARNEGPRLRSSASRLTPLVGRDRILSQATKQVEAWWEQATEREAAVADPRVLILQGPTAIGKSRLALELCSRLRSGSQRPVSATVHCSEHSGLPDFAAELCAIAGLSRDNLPGRWAALTALAAQAWGEEPAAQLAAHLPLLGYVLQSEDVDSSGVRQSDSSSFALACRLALKACIELAALAGGGRVLLVVEDLQWLGGLRETLSWLLESCQTSQPLLLIGTARPSFDASTSALLALMGRTAEPAEAGSGEPGAVLNVVALSPAEGDELLATLLPGLVLPDSVRTELHEKSLGLPYYYEEVARMLLAEGAVREEGGRFTAAREIAGLDMPSDFRMLILGRLDLLRPELRELAGHASVLGRSFSAEMLERLEARIAGSAEPAVAVAQPARVEMPAAAGPQAELDQFVDGLVAERILSRDGGGRISFEHRLTQEAAYSSLLQSNRAQLHRAAAELLKADLVPGTAAEWDILPELARHYESAGAYEEAFETYCSLMVIATSVLDSQQWEVWNLKARTCFGKEDPERSPIYLRAIGRQDIATGDYDGAQRHLYSALNILENQTAVSYQHAAILCDLGGLHARLHDTALAEGCFQQALLEAVNTESMELMCESKLGLGQLYYHQGRIEPGVQLLEQALEHAGVTADLRKRVMILILLGSAQLDLNESQTARASFAEALMLARNIRDRVNESVALGNLAVSLQAAAENETALEYYQLALANDVELGRQRGQAYNLMNIGHLYFEMSRLDDAQAALEQALLIFNSLDDRWGSGLVNATLGEVFINKGSFEAAHSHLLSAEALMKDADDSFRRGLLQCSWARYYLSIGFEDKAQLSLAKAEALNLHTGTGQSSYLAEQIAAIRSSSAQTRANSGQSR